MKKNNSNKGFTLVELIVVLVILAILAAILVPALLGYIDRAREKQYVLNAKSALTATQAEFSSLYGEGATIVTSGSDLTFNVDSSNKLTTRSEVVKNTADTPADTHFFVAINANATDGSTEITGAVPKNHNRYTVTNAYYVENGYYITYNGTSWVSTTTAPSAPTGLSWTQIY